MNVLVSIPIAVHQAFLGRCLLASREYAVLKNALIRREPTNAPESNMVEILCAPDDAERLLDLARQVYPQAIPYIEKAICQGGSENFGASLSAGLQEPDDAPGPYRIKTSGATWHFCSNCSQWPTDDFISSKALSNGDQLCNECLVKKQHGECNGPQ